MPPGNLTTFLQQNGIHLACLMFNNNKKMKNGHFARRLTGVSRNWCRLAPRLSLQFLLHTHGQRNFRKGLCEEKVFMAEVTAVAWQTKTRSWFQGSLRLVSSKSWESAASATTNNWCSWGREWMLNVLFVVQSPELQHCGYMHVTLRYSSLFKYEARAFCFGVVMFQSAY